MLGIVVQCGRRSGSSYSGRVIGLNESIATKELLPVTIVCAIFSRFWSTATTWRYMLFLEVY